MHRQFPIHYALFALLAGAMVLGVTVSSGEEGPKPKEPPSTAKESPPKKSTEPKKGPKPTTDKDDKKPEKKPEESESKEDKETKPQKETKPEKGEGEETSALPEDGMPSLSTTPVAPKMELGPARATLAKDILGGFFARPSRATDLSGLFAADKEAFVALLKLSEAALSGDPSRLPDRGTMDRLKASQPKEWDEILTAYAQRYGPPAFPTGIRLPDVDERVNGYSAAFGHDDVSGGILYKGLTIPVLYYKTLTGSRVGFFPPIDVARDTKAGRCKVYVVDPATKFDPVHPVTNKVLTPEEFLQAVLAGEIPRDRKFHFTIELAVHNGTEIAAAVRQGLKKQLAGPFENEPAIPRTAADVSRDDVYPIDVALAAFREVGFFCTSEGWEGLRFTRKMNNPKLGAMEEISVTAPAEFICQLFSSAGASFRAEFRYDAFRGELTEARVFEQTRGNAAVTAKELGKGGLSTHDETQIGEDGKNRTTSDVKILVERNKVLKNVSNLGTTSRTLIVGASPEIINTLLTILHNHYKDTPSATAKEVGEFYSHTLGWKARLEESGYVDRIHAAASRQEFTENERTLLNEMMHAEGRSNQFAMGLRALAGKIPLGLNAGGGSVRVSEDGKVHFSDEFGRKFINALSTIAKGGHFPIPPDMDLVLVSEQDVRKQFDQVVAHARPGGVRSYTLSASFTSRAPSLQPAAGVSTGEDATGQPRLRATAPPK